MVVFDKQKYVHIKKKSNVFCYLYSLFNVNIINEQELRLRIIISSKGKTIKINNVKKLAAGIYKQKKSHHRNPTVGQASLTS